MPVSDRWTRVPCWVSVHVCVCEISDWRRAIKREVIVSEHLHMGSFSASVPAVQTKGARSEQGVGKKHEMGRQLQALVTVIYK